MSTTKPQPSTLRRLAELGAALIDQAERLPVRAEACVEPTGREAEPYRSMRYFAGDVEIELVEGEATPDVYLFGREAKPLDEVLRQLPALLALLADPRVQALVERQTARAA